MGRLLADAVAKLLSVTNSEDEDADLDFDLILETTRRLAAAWTTGGSGKRCEKSVMCPQRSRPKAPSSMAYL